MRVALIGPVPPELGGATPGGVATHQAHLAAGLAARGVDAPLLASNASAPGPKRAPFPIQFNAETWSAFDPIVPYALRLGLGRVQGSRREVLKNLLSYRRFLNQVWPDVVHVQHPLERCLYVRMVQWQEGWQQPLVVTAHSLFGEHPHETIQTLMAPNLRAAKRVIAVSEHVAEQAVELGVEAERVRLIRSGVDTEHFRPGDRTLARRGLGLPQEAPIVLFIGNLEPRKQVDVLLRAIAEVRGRAPDALLVVVGSGESAGAMDQSKYLRRLTAELALSDNIRFVGRVDDEQLLDYYAAADVFALPSSSEAQGIVALEAMACGLPVVVAAVGGLRRTVADGETGYLVPSGDVDRLAQRLGELLVRPARAAAMGAAARQAVERDFSWPRAIEATVDVYREVLGCR